MKRIKGQNLIVTRGVIERLDSLRISLYVKYKGVQRGARLMGMTRVYLYNLMRGERTPSLDVYLKLAKVFDWDLSRDVNYAYAMVMYPPAEIKRRLQRVFSLSLTLKSIASFFCIHGYGEITMIYDSMTYGYYRNSRVYASVMRKLALYEKLLGYSDALRFEE